jgi:CheY-like chemotaxis protein
VKLSITDTGSGVPQEIQNRIFDPYFTTKKAGEGTGLGLSVSSGIIQNHQGLIDLESAPDQGAVFSVYLPVAEKPRHVAITDEQNIPKGQGEKILFIDDELFFLEAMEEQLNSLGYQVMAVQSSLNALEIIKSAPHGFDLIITDQTMPDMTGVQLSAEIHRLNLQIPIILCTGFSETITEQTARDYGISKFLMKPVNRGDLAKAVYEVLG